MEQKIELLHSCLDCRQPLQRLILLLSINELKMIQPHKQVQQTDLAFSPNGERILVFRSLLDQ